VLAELNAVSFIEQCGMARVGWQLAICADQKDVNHFPQTRELSFVIQDYRLDSGTLSDES
jgi:hypothetical protein